MSAIRLLVMTGVFGAAALTVALSSPQQSTPRIERPFALLIGQSKFSARSLRKRLR